MNLAINARDAIESGPAGSQTGGAITIRTRGALLDEDAALRVPPLSPGRFVILEVSDTGPGIPSEIRPRIFEPYFSTRTGERRGTGLGLATVYSIVEAHGGAIEVLDAREPGAAGPRGTTMRVWLRASTESPAAPDGRTVPATGRPAVETVTADVPAPRVYVAHRTHPFGTQGYDVTTVLGTVLGSGRGSRLYQRLADGERIAQPDLVGAYGVDLAHAPAPLIATATARPGVSAERLRDGLAEVVDELATVPVTAAELDRAKALLSTMWWRQMSTVDGRADTLGRYATQFGDPARAADRLPAWLAVTAEQIAEQAAELLGAADRVILTYLPEEN